jgi:orotate phosphoribosyltransferase-like protein
MPVYQVLAPKIRELKALGLSNEDIAARLKIHRKTAAKGLLCKYN